MKHTMSIAIFISIFAISMFADTNIETMQNDYNKKIDTYAEQAQRLFSNQEKNITNNLTNFKQPEELSVKLKPFNNNAQSNFINKTPIFILFTSLSVKNNNSVLKYHIQSRKLKESFSDIRFFIALKGIPTDIKQLYTAYKPIDDKDSPITLKITPRFFKEVNLDKVPAWGIALCPENFIQKECSIEYILHGSSDLEYFLSLVSEKDKQYLKYYKKLIEP